MIYTGQYNLHQMGIQNKCTPILHKIKLVCRQFLVTALASEKNISFGSGNSQKNMLFVNNLCSLLNFLSGDG